METTETDEQQSGQAGSGTNLSRADVHLHTNLGDGTASPERVIAEARRRGLRVIAVTDHDHFEGAKRVQELLDRESERQGARDIELVWGCEVTTRHGHFLGLFMRRPVKFLCHVEAAIEAIKEQGGITVIPHPMGRLVPSLSQRKIEELLEEGYPLDAVELYNPSPANASRRAEVAVLNNQWGLATTGGSDAHFWQHIGAGYTLFPGETAEDLRQALLARTTHPGGMETPPERLPLSAYAGQQVLSLIIDPPRKLARMLRSRGETDASRPLAAK